MSDVKCCNPYESNKMVEITGETLRPGGFSLTDIGVQYCNISPEDTVLDLGCGRGATVNHLCKKYNITVVGIDPSEIMIEAAKGNYGYADFFLGKGEQLPFEDESFDCVFAECTLSLMDSLDSVIKQVYRVLKENGWFVITDIYAKNAQGLTELRNYPADGCMSGMHDLGLLRNRLEQVGFFIAHLEDFSQYLKELIVKIGFSNGSLCDFWNSAAQECMNGEAFYKVMKQCKPGYFLMIARKKGEAYGG